MPALLLHLAVLVNAAVLTLPPGWCILVLHCGAKQTQATAVEKKANCCHRQQPAEEPGPAPDEPAPKCCCARDVPLPKQAVLPIDPPAMILPIAAEPGDVAAGYQVGPAIEICPFGTGPKLHVLHCVWRC